jgi:septum formation protein
MTTLADAPIVLASASKTRARLLHDAGLEVEIFPAEIDEEAIREGMAAEHAPPVEIARALAELKALRVSRHHGSTLVVGADQILSCGGTIHSKPGNRDAAARQLAALSGKTHSLASAVCVARQGDILWHHVELVELRMRRLSDGLIARYLDAAGPDIYANAGSYAIEGLGIQLFTGVHGDHFAIQGLPLLPLLAFLREHKVVP